MKHTHDLVAVTGKYTDATGQEKKRFHTIGKVFIRDDGSETYLIESLPIAGTWNGWVNRYVKRDWQGAGPGQAPGQASGQHPGQHQAPAQAPYGQGSNPPGGYGPAAARPPSQAANAAHMAMQAPPPADDYPDADVPF